LEIGFQFWCNDTEDFWGTTGTYFLTTSSGNVTIEIDQISVSTLRVDVDTNVNITWHSRYNNNQSSCTSGSIFVNGSEYVINSTGWSTVPASSAVVTKKVYTVTGANVSGETDYQQIPPNPELIWDRLEVYGYNVSDTRADVDSSVTFWWKLRYDYDSVVFSNSKGIVEIGESYGAWNMSGEGRWQRLVKLPSAPQNYSQVLTFTDWSYGLTNIIGIVSQSVIADKLQVTFSTNDTRVKPNDPVEISWQIKRQYDDSSVTSFKLSTSRNGYLWHTDLTNMSATDVPTSFGDYVYDVYSSSVTDQTYDLTAFDSITTAIVCSVFATQEVDSVNSTLATSGFPYIYDGTDYIVSLQFVSNTLTFIVQAESASTTEVYCGALGRPPLVTIGISWSYDSATTICTVNVVHSSDQEVRLGWTTEHVTVSTNVYFGLPIYATYINFNSESTFTWVYREDSYWYFDDFGFQVENANLTVTDFFEANADTLTFDVVANSGVNSITKVYCGGKGEPVSVSGATSYAFNNATNVLMANVTHQSNQQIVLDWSQAGVESNPWDMAVAISYMGVALFGVLIVVAGVLALLDPRHAPQYVVFVICILILAFLVLFLLAQMPS